MFKHEGPARSFRLNVILASFLAFTAGYVNSGGFIMLGRFTSHVTGNVGHLADGIARADAGVAALACALILAFFFGAFLASLILERQSTKVSRKYGIALAFEAALLAAFVPVHGRLVAPLLLSAAMGMQNSLMTRLSGAVVRTTHLTGLVTDLGIEASRWLRFRFFHGDRPVFAQTMLLLTIVAAFVVGATGGALLTLRVSHWAMAFPAVAILGASAYAVLVD